MKSIYIYLFLLLSCTLSAYSQTLEEAKDLYLKKEYAKALPVVEAEYKAKPDDATLNQWYGVCLMETGGDLNKAEECLLVASKKKIQESFLYLGVLYGKEYKFAQATEAFGKYEAMLKKKDDAARANLEDRRKEVSRIHRMVSNTEDVQIIDSVIVDKDKFLSAYKLSLSSGHIDYFRKVFPSEKAADATVYFNEKETKMYYSKPDKDGAYTLYSKEKLLDKYGNEKKLSENNFGLVGNVNYPYVMTDGVTIYFAAQDEDSMGGYDLFVSRYNMNNDNYLAPERLNMPFNSLYNDYMMVVDEEKGVGWFATDRYMPEGKVCIYTFIPNKVVKIIQSEDDAYLAGRARISSIKDTWAKDRKYKDLIALARKVPVVKTEVTHDFEFVINDKYTYYKLSDFKNRSASGTYAKALDLIKDGKYLSDGLAKLRDSYASSPDNQKRSMTEEILNTEKKLERLQTEIKELEIQARNQEIQSLK
ncbi:tetratricopeptide repeat protein [Dysgonomonas reticulitermitis]